jgi:hypothetical protein
MYSESLAPVSHIVRFGTQDARVIDTTQMNHAAIEIKVRIVSGLVTTDTYDFRRSITRLSGSDRRGWRYRETDGMGNVENNKKSWKNERPSDRSRSNIDGHQRSSTRGQQTDRH